MHLFQISIIYFLLIILIDTFPNPLNLRLLYDEWHYFRFPTEIDYAINILEKHYLDLIYNKQPENILKKKMQITIISHMILLNNIKNNENKINEISDISFEYRYSQEMGICNKI
ncbi:hypothetical protein Mgra_00010291 [Meloidogyne graminicola]|uniref:Uncharacterized protein n=1 Tax=Meloidogyne graminicola TaxID=189291 RepID=A0A8S9ZB34_9BILA|nr:hypothetical protein Mgra_00010291 [Meloidogyne graminicola]